MSAGTPKAIAPEVTIEATTSTGFDQGIATVVGEDRPDMSLAEAQARYLAAIAARAYSEEQFRLVNGAKNVNVDSMVELKRSLVALPSEQVTGVIETMVANPSLLSDETIAQLASSTGRQGLGRPRALLAEDSVRVAGRSPRVRGTGLNRT